MDAAAAKYVTGEELIQVVERIIRERGIKEESQQQAGPLQWSALVEALTRMGDQPHALLAAAPKLPKAAPKPLEGAALDEACAAAAGQLPAALQAYHALRPQVDPTADMAAEDGAVNRALASTFGMLDKVAARAAEGAEQQLAAPAAAAAAAAPGAAAGNGGGVGGNGGNGGAAAAGPVYPYEAAKQALMASQDASQAAEALAALAAAVAATAPQLTPEAGQKLSELARPSRSATNAAKRAQIAVTRSLAEAAKAEGWPAFASGVQAAVLAKLSDEEGVASKSLMWLRRAAELLQGKVREDMEAAIAAAAPPPLKPRNGSAGAGGAAAAGGAAGAGAGASVAGAAAAAAAAEEEEEEPLTPEEEAAEQARLAELARLQRAEQVEKERAVLAFVSRVAAAIGTVASLAGGKLDLNSISSGSDALPTAPCVDAAAILDCAARIAEAEDAGAAGAGGVAAEQLAWSPAMYAGEDEQDEARVLIKMCRNLAIVQVANEAIRLAGSHPDVAGIEDGISSNLKTVLDVALQRSRFLVKQARKLEKDSQRSVAAPLKAALREASTSAALVAIDDSFVEGVMKKGMHEVAADAIEDGSENTAEGIVLVIMQCVEGCLDFSFYDDSTGGGGGSDGGASDGGDGSDGGDDGGDSDAGTSQPGGGGSGGDGASVAPRQWQPDALRGWQKSVVLRLADIIKEVEDSLPGERHAKGVGYHNDLRTQIGEALQEYAAGFKAGLEARLTKAVQDAWDDCAAGERWKADFVAGVASAIDDALDVSALSVRDAVVYSI